MPFTILERLSADTEGLAASLTGGSVRGAVVVATCNRIETYLDLDRLADEPEAIERVLRALAERSGMEHEELARGVRVHRDLAATEHLFAVASGLESVAVGEGEIAGQVRQSLETARAEGTTSSELERVFQQAAQTSRSVRQETRLDQAGRSLVSLALDLASSRVLDWEHARVVLVGTGRFARVALAGLRRRGAHDIAVHSPSGRAAAFAGPRGLVALSAEEAPAALDAADVIVTCSNAGVVVGPEQLSARDLAATGAPRLVVDLGLPRNVDPAVSSVGGTTLLDLETVRLHAPLDEFQTSDAARELVADAARSFADHRRAENAAPAIAAMHGHMSQVLEAELARSVARGESAETQAALRHLVGVLLHEPTMRARDLAREGRTALLDDAVEALFPVVVERRESRDEHDTEDAASA